MLPNRFATHRAPRLLACLLSCLLPGCTPAPHGLPGAEVLESASGQAWYRGNLHTHTLWSDGDHFPEGVISSYRSLGYDFIVLTEHDRLPEGERWVRADEPANRTRALVAMQEAGTIMPTRPLTGSDGTEVQLTGFPALVANADGRDGFLLVQGEEISDSVDGISVHIGAINLARPLGQVGGEDVGKVIEGNLSSIAAAGDPARPTVGIVNHPNFVFSLTAEQVAAVPAVTHLEISNGHPISMDPGDSHRPSAERFWDIVLSLRGSRPGYAPVQGVATDDAHHFLVDPDDGASPGRGWVRVLAPRLEARALVEALAAGRFHASTGVALARIERGAAGLAVEVVAEPGVDYVIEFVGTRAGFVEPQDLAHDEDGKPMYATRRYGEDVGAVFARHKGTAASYRFRPDDLYVRARVTASSAHPNPSHPLQLEMAWTPAQPGPAWGRGDARAMPAPPPLALHREAMPRLREMPGGVPPVGAGVACSLDQVADGRGRPTDILARDQDLLLGGWVADPAARTVPRVFRAWLAGERVYRAESAHRGVRTDVAAALGQPEFEAAGFNLALNLAPVAPGRYRILLQPLERPEAGACDTMRELIVE